MIKNPECKQTNKGDALWFYLDLHKIRTITNANPPLTISFWWLASNSLRPRSGLFSFEFGQLKELHANICFHHDGLPQHNKN